jgi:hypothetical protein
MSNLLASKSPKNMAKAKRLIKGLTLEWDDLNPLDATHVVNTKVGHRNPITRLSAKEMVRQYAQFIFERIRMVWRVQIIMFFQYANGDKYQEEIELECNCHLNSLNDHCLSEIEQGKKLHAKDAYRFTSFKIECIGF